MHNWRDPMDPIDPLVDDDDEDGDEDSIELEVPRFDECRVIHNTRRPVNVFNPGRVSGCGHLFFAAAGPRGVVLYG